MATRRVKFVWGSTQTIRGRWYLGLVGLYDRRSGRREDGIAISVRGLLAWAGAGAGVAYVCAALALFWMWDRDPYSMRTVGDALLFPVRRPLIQQKNGQALLARGLDAMLAERWQEGATLLRQGLVLAPGDWSARTRLAQFYAGTNQWSLAMRVLGEGLRGGYPGKARLASAFGLAVQAEDYGFVVEASRRFLPLIEGVVSLSERRWLFAQEIAALLADRRIDDAEARLTAAGDLAGREQRVLLLLERRRFDEAMSTVAEWSGQPGADSGVVGRLLARVCREAGRFEEMERALRIVRAQNPADPEGWAFTVQQRALAGLNDAATAALEEFLFRFGGSAENLQLIGALLADGGHLPLVRRCVAAAAERGYPMRAFQILLATTSLQGGEWASARGAVVAIRERRGSAGELAWREWMIRLIDAAEARSDGAVLRLSEILRTRNWPARTFRVTVSVLRMANQAEGAREVLALAQRLFPASTWIQQQAEQIAQELARRAPVQPAPVALAKVPLAEKVFFQRLDEMLAGGEWSAAEDLLREIRLADVPPDWVAVRGSDLRFAEMRVAQARGERARLLALAAIYLNGDNGRARQALDFARTIHAQGDQEVALALVHAVMERSPDNPAARKLLAEWRPAAGRSS